MAWKFWNMVKRATRRALAGATAPRIQQMGDAVDQIGQQFKAQDWQMRAWDIFDCVGETSTAPTRIARLVSSQLDYIVNDLDADQSKILLTGLLRTDLIEFARLIALNIQVNGEFWIFDMGPDKPFEIRSPVDPDLKDLEETSKAHQRIWNAHPKRPELAECGFRKVIEPGEELYILSKLSRAQSHSRIAQAGVILYPIQQQDIGGDPFSITLPQAMTAAIKDVSSPAAFAPIVHKMDKELIEAVRHFTITRDFDDQIPEKVERAIRRIALSQEAPPELLLGNSESNHWNAWLTQEDTYKTVVEPVANFVIAALMWAWVQRMPEQPAIIDADPARLLAKRSTVRDAIDAAKIGAVSFKYVRACIGASDEDAMTPEDIAILKEITGRNGNTETSDATVDQTQSAPNNGNVPAMANGNGRKFSISQTREYAIGR